MFDNGSANSGQERTSAHVCEHVYVRFVGTFFLGTRRTTSNTELKLI